MLSNERIHHKHTKINSKFDENANKLAVSSKFPQIDDTGKKIPLTFNNV